jgi:haloalkane dehalogenase
MAVLGQYDRPFLTAFSDDDAATRGWDKVFQDHVPGAKNQPHTTLSAGHFVVEQKGDELAGLITQFVSGAR